MMGADCLIMALVIPDDEQPDWDAGEKWIADLSDSDAEQIGDGRAWDGDPKEELRSLLRALRDNLGAERNRELDWVFVAGNKVYVTGGMSGGDSPTDLFDVFSDAASTGLAGACGFRERAFQWDAFSVSARANLEVAEGVLQQEAEQLRNHRERAVAARIDSAAATIRELLRLPAGAYGSQ